MLRIAHLAAALALLAAHATFLGRGLYLHRVGRGPSALDRAARSLSQLLLPLTALLGILLVFVGRLVLRRRTEAPWLLPALNLALIVAALATGFAAARATGQAPG
jgi:hypothetical protein